MSSNPPSDYFVHPSAIVDPGAVIGKGSKIWHFCHVMGGARVGEGCILGQNVFVAAHAVLGRGCKVQNNVSLYDGVELGDEVFCGPSMVFTNVYNPRSAVTRKDEYRRTLVKQGATIGANATIVCGSTVGRYAFVGAGAVVQKAVPDFALVVGVPARQIGWMSRFGERLELPLQGSGEAVCPHTGERYVLQDGVVSVAECPPGGPLGS